MLQSLGYIGLRAKNVDDWASAGTGLFGLQLAERTSSTLRFRMDDRKQRIMVEADGGQGASFLGFEAADGAALDALAAKLESSGVAVARMPRALADQRRVAAGIVFADPAGNRIEAFQGAEVAGDPFKPGRAISGFRTGALGMGHVVLNVSRIAPMMAFYQDLLGFRLSDYFVSPVKAYFMHLNPRHHTLALIERGEDSVHHMMIETFMLDDVGQGYDIALQDKGRIAQTFGRHINDMMTSFYSYTPSGFMLEYGWGGRTIDPATWTPEEVADGPSLWGHERHWLPPESRAEARAQAMRAAANGLRSPVQVMDGNHTLVPGTCPWFDAMRSESEKSAG